MAWSDVDIVVFGKHVEVPPALRAHTIEKLDRLSKYAKDVRRVDVDYAEHSTRRAADSHECEILVHVNKHLVKAHACAPDHHAALDVALERVEQQMRRLHERRVRRRGAAKNGRGTTGPPGAPVAESVIEVAEETIVKVKTIAVKPMDPEEAALQMELLGHDFFLFTMATSGRAAVLYRRRDGRLGMIEASG